MKFIKRFIGWVVIIVLLIIVAGVVSIFGPQIWSGFCGEPDYSVTLPADARPVTERYDILSVKGDDGQEHPLILPRIQPPSPPPNRFLTGPQGRAAVNAEEVLRSSGVPADVYVVKGTTTGEPVMVVSLEISQGLPSTGQGLEEMISQLLSACRSEGVELAGIAAVLHSEEGEPLMAISTSTGEALAFRDGEIPADEAMEHLGVSLIDRKAIIDLLSELRP
ncbi:hypothetical protein ACFLUU_08430 [Chloroflexota bacterium]